MSDSYEIIDDGPCIRIVSPDSTISTIVGRPVGYHIDDAVIGAIRQQARDIAELETEVSGLRSSEAAFKNDCDQLRAEARALSYRAKTLDMLALRILGDEESEDFVKDELDHLQPPSDWLPFESPAYVVAQCIDERDQLRADLAAAVGERDEARAAVSNAFGALASCGYMRNEHDRVCDAIFSLHSTLTQRPADWKLRAEQAEARLAAIEAAPTVATICVDHDFMHIQRGLMLPPIGTELIARPTKD